MILHDPPLHLLILMRNELITRQIRVIWIVLSHVIPTFRLDDVAGHKGGGVVIALHQPLREVPFHLEAEEVPGVFLFQLAWIGRVELHAEIQKGVNQGETQLTGNGFLQIQPVLQHIKEWLMLILIYSIILFFNKMF